jgi:hypothetical protein
MTQEQAYATWWWEEGSGILPLPTEDMEEFAHRITQIAWSNAAYREREALAQTQEPSEKFCDSNCVWTDHHPDCKLAQTQEPVAWMDADGNVSDNNDHKCFPIPLYTTPPQRTEQEPLAHWSDCAVHSEPAYPKSECDCGGIVAVADYTALSDKYVALSDKYVALKAQHKEQEPVAWMLEGWGPDCGPYFEIYRDDEMGWRNKKEWTPLYTTPPQRTWVGLDHQDKKKFSSWLDHKTDDEVFTAIDDLLREMNT